MKRKTTIFMFFTSFLLIAQQGYVEYGYIESLGIGNAKGIDYNSELIFNNENSYFVTCKESMESLEKIYGSKTVTNEEGEVEAIINGMNLSKEGNQVFFSNRSRKLYSTLNYDEFLYINDSIVVIDWKIEKETKKIGSFNCKKATANFRGRSYIVWFTTEIPLPYGPWKLNGLPGLIVEAYDKEKFVYWYFKNIQYPFNSNKEIVDFYEGNSQKFISYKEYKKFQQNKFQKFEEKKFLLKQRFPNITYEPPKIHQMFIECEE